MTIPCLGSTSAEILSRFHDRATAEHLEETLLEALSRLGLTISDVRSLSTDAAAVMKKLGKLLKNSAAPSPFYRQLCHAHGIHLAVLDTLSNDQLCINFDNSPSESENEGDEGGSSSWHLAGITRPRGSDHQDLLAGDGGTFHVG